MKSQQSLRATEFRFSVSFVTSKEDKERNPKIKYQKGRKTGKIRVKNKKGKKK
jgi:hypothetical protein